eukprot:CAMPEP_0170467450 /NCGR_PEP_ID=MMETSP0123-20130129/11023_1 /TAXON_ID=182087 /ORGANISM="Favella ehrenbergii, Strain Fehren 1" /LENGTH=273 /DNA_ID=CAMNT_0010733817 /DNA_START=565 /DNA_END=1385 /DNA_ORIENTATION=-
MSASEDSKAPFVFDSRFLGFRVNLSRILTPAFVTLLSMCALKHITGELALDGQGASLAINGSPLDRQTLPMEDRRAVARNGAGHFGLVDRKGALMVHGVVDNNDSLVLAPLLQDAPSAEYGDSHGKERNHDAHHQEDQRVRLLLDDLGLAGDGAHLDLLDNLGFFDRIRACIGLILVEELLNNLLDSLELLLIQIIFGVLALAEVVFGVFAHQLVRLQRDRRLNVIPRLFVWPKAALDLLVCRCDRVAVDRGRHARLSAPTACACGGLVRRAR